MARWLSVDAILHSVADEEIKERLGIEELTVQTLIKPITIDLDRIESYAASLDKEGDEVEDQVDVILYSGLSMTLKKGFVEFDKLVRAK